MKGRTILSLFLCVALLFGLCAMPTKATETDFIIENGVITGYTGAGGDIYVPDTVTGIGRLAFAYNNSITTVNIPSSVANIAQFAFIECASLTSINVDAGNVDYTSENGVLFDKQMKTLIQYPGGKSGTYTIPAGVTDVGDSAFYNSGIQNITVTDGVEIIGDCAFIDCYGLTAVVLPGTLKVIGDSAFEDCTMLENITIPGAVQSIGIGSFAYCFSLQTVVIEDGVKSIGGGAFQNCTNLVNLTVPGSVTSIGKWAFYSTIWFETKTEEFVFLGDDVLVKYNGTNADVVIPNRAKHIGDGVFYQSALITQITLLNGILDIGNESFYSCVNLTGVQLPASVKTIGEGAFYNCFGIESVTLESGIEIIGESAFDSCRSLTTVTIPGTVAVVSDYVFRGCSGLLSVTLNNGAAEIGIASFKNCSKLTVLTVPGSVKSIAAGAFEGCTGLTQVTIENGVESIDDMAFYGCSALPAISLPETIKSIGNDSFCECRALKSIIVDENSVEFSSAEGVLFNKAKTTLIRFPQGKALTYNIPAGVAAIAANAFKGCDGLLLAVVPNEVTTIGSNAFQGCDMLTVVCGSGSYTAGYTQTNGVRHRCRYIYAAENTDIHIDFELSLIYGFPPALESLDAFLNAEDGAVMDNIPSAGTIFGTGSFVQGLLDGEFVEMYQVVIFGDINGDGTIDSMDAGVATDLENYLIGWDPYENAAYFKAGDLNGDGSIDSLDAGKMVDYENYLVEINQGTGLAG